MSRWKVLPHRLADGRCRDCGWLSAATAPDTCARCYLERCEDRGIDVVYNPVHLFEIKEQELWRIVAQQLRSGQLRSGRCYVFIGHGDGGPLERPSAELFDSSREFALASEAAAIALELTQRYPQAWVVTTVGCWAVS